MSSPPLTRPTTAQPLATARTVPVWRARRWWRRRRHRPPLEDESGRRSSRLSAACRRRTAPEPGDSVVGLSVDQVNRRFAAACAAAGLEGRRTSHGGRVGLAAELTVSWLSRTTGVSYRLPTEAEWDRAAAGSQAGCSDVRTGNNGTCPVGSYGSNAAGLSGHGRNLWEWTEDCWEGDCGRRVLRGAAARHILKCGGRGVRIAHMALHLDETQPHGHILVVAADDHQLIVIARDDDTTFGILHSRFHELWSLRLCTWLGKGNDPRYTPSTTFETFPFPAGLTPDVPAADYEGNACAAAITEAARVRASSIRSWSWICGGVGRVWRECTASVLFV